MTAVGPSTPVVARPGRLHWVDVTRGLAVLLVVFYHVVIALKVDSVAAPGWAVVLNDALAPFRIPTLMFCSGLLLARSLRKPPGTYLVGKLRHIAWPWAVWTTVIVVFLWAGSSVAGDGNYGPGRLVELVLSPTTYTWYLAYLLAFYVVSLVIPRAARSAAVPLLLVVSVVVHDGDGWTRVTFLLAFFFLGDAAARHQDVFESLARRRIVIALGAVAALGTAIASTQLPGLRYDLVAAVGVVGLVVVAVPLGGRLAPTLLGRGLSAMGRDSIVYYTTHWIVVTLGVHALGLIGLHQGTLMIVALLTAGLTAPWVMARLSRRSRLVAGLYAWPARRTSSSPKGQP
ncbi:acyltransferase [Frigoribacterium sp. PhB118]|uniref:acyltransferase family protein n=1 Tax=Frigoribacterium sp. PhB118 TaxID=2485175 RepID=UPI000F491865|nr:acyltransferase [Frigoribacterium sp. PhB118]ROS52184.1 putative membrane protein YcfT [Frigoribacterium sp. PhB118]